MFLRHPKSTRTATPFPSPTLFRSGVSGACGYTRNFTAITEHVRARLARQISNDQVNHDGFIPMITLSAQWEQAFAEAIVGDGEERQLSMAPTRLQDFINAVRQTFERHAMLGEDRKSTRLNSSH